MLRIRYNRCGWLGPLKRSWMVPVHWKEVWIKDIKSAAIEVTSVVPPSPFHNQSTHRPCWNHICDNFKPSMLCFMTQGMSRHSVTLNTTNMFLCKFCLILGFTVISLLIPCWYSLLLLLLLLFSVLVIISLMAFFFKWFEICLGLFESQSALTQDLTLKEVIHIFF